MPSKKPMTKTPAKKPAAKSRTIKAPAAKKPTKRKAYAAFYGKRLMPNSVSRSETECQIAIGAGFASPDDVIAGWAVAQKSGVSIKPVSLFY